MPVKLKRAGFTSDVEEKKKKIREGREDMK